MRQSTFLTFLFLLSFCSCGLFDNTLPVEECSEFEPYIIGAEPEKESIIFFHERPQVNSISQLNCHPQLLEFYFSEDNVDFEKISSIEATDGSFRIDGLEDGKEYYYQMVSVHDKFSNFASTVRSIIVGEIASPELMPIPITGTNSPYTDLKVSPNREKHIYNLRTDRWYLSSFSDLNSSEEISNYIEYIQWNPKDETEVAILQFANTFGGAAANRHPRRIITRDLDSNIVNVIHEIPETEYYLVNALQYSSDGTALYFISNKDTAGFSNNGISQYNDLWKIDLQSGILEKISNFSTIEFDFYDFKEDPKQSGNFYITGGYSDDKVSTPGLYFNDQQIDVYYYSPTNETLTPLFKTETEEKFLSINPTGDHLVFTSNRSGKEELWSYDLQSKQIKQLTTSRYYRLQIPTHHLNWISDNQFMIVIIKDNNDKFATFTI